MLIKEITIVGYTRFLDSIKKFHWTPLSPLSLIIGGNGSGKSSLLNELNPMPANKNDYYPGGYKEIHIVFNNTLYILRSDFNKGQLHSFKKQVGDLFVELNESGTITIQKELVDKIFRYNNTIHYILTGVTKFTNLSPSQRKELLMTISPLDLGYANELFDTVKTRLRDDQGAIKHQIIKSEDIHTRLGNITINEDKDTVIELEKTIELLLPYKGNQNIDIDKVEYRLKQLKDKLDNTIKSIYKFNTNIRLPEGVTEISHLQKYIGMREGQLQSNVVSVKELQKKLSNIETILHDNPNKLSIEDINNRLTIINNELSKYNEEYTIVDHFDYRIKTLIETGQRIENLFPSEQIFIFSDEEIKTHTEKHMNVLADLLRTASKLNDLKQKIKHYETEEQGVLCPKCNIHLTMTGKDIKEEIIRLKENEKKGEALLDKLENLHKETNVIESRVNVYVTLKNEINSIRNSDKGYYHFWNSVPPTDKIIESSSILQNVIIQYCSYIERCKNYYELRKEKEQYDNLIKQYNTIGEYIDSPTQLEKEIEILITQQYHYKDEIKLYKEWLDKYIHYNRLADEVVETQVTIINLLLEWGNGIIQNDSKSKLEVIYSKLGTIKHLVQQKELLENTLNEINSDIANLKERQQLWELLSSALSPTKGIIAEQMIAFLNSYIDQINKVISQIWQHELMLKYTSGTLDYYFPLIKEGKVVDDISSCSSGQKEIIDLAFILIMRQYLGLVEYPLYLDETGSTFDDSHRSYLIKFIKFLIDSQQCQQIFMINHYANWNGGLSNYETVVLDKRNIVVPSVYNQNVKIE